MPRRPRVPSYRHHKPSSQAVVTIHGRDHYLGIWGSEESKAEYQRLITELWSSGCVDEPSKLSVGELILRFWRHAEGYYRKDGQPTSELSLIRQAMRPVNSLYGHRPAAQFGPLALKACRQAMIDAGTSRSVVNAYVGRAKRMFRWAVENELIPPSVYEGLRAVSGLRRGRSEARETEGVEPVPEEHARAVFPFVSAEVRAMIELQLLTGMRPGEVVIMRACDLEIGTDVWQYSPSTHKMAHRGRPRVVFLGPRAQEVLRPFLRPEIHSPLFSPLRADSVRNGARRRKRMSPMTPSQARRRPGVVGSEFPHFSGCEGARHRSLRRALLERSKPVSYGQTPGVERWLPPGGSSLTRSSRSPEPAVTQELEANEGKRPLVTEVAGFRVQVVCPS